MPSKSLVASGLILQGGHREAIAERAPPRAGGVPGFVDVAFRGRSRRAVPGKGKTSNATSQRYFDVGSKLIQRPHVLQKSRVNAPSLSQGGFKSATFGPPSPSARPYFPTRAYLPRHHPTFYPSRPMTRKAQLPIAKTPPTSPHTTTHKNKRFNSTTPPPSSVPRQRTIRNAHPAQS